MLSVKQIKETYNDYDVIVPNRVNEVDVDELKVYADDKPESVETLEDFTTLLSHNLNLSPEDWLPMITPMLTDVYWEAKNKRYSESKDEMHLMNYEDECVKLQISAVSNDCVELQWIEIKEKCKGMGSNIMNTILDTADELKVDVRVLPVDFDPGNTKPIVYLRWLRDWYKSFEFKSYSSLTPALKYFHNS